MLEMSSSLASSARLAALIIMLAAPIVLSLSVAEMRAKWEGVSDGIEEINEQAKAEKVPVEAVSVSSNQVPEDKPAVNPDALPLTSTLVAWISSQSEGMVEEMEAIANQNAQASTFSVVNYLRYLRLYDSLKVIARQPVPELKWVSRKAKVFSKVYHAANEIVLNHLYDLDSQLDKIEAAEPKGKAKEVSKEWLELYESIRYIATHAPLRSDLAKTATSFLAKSPHNTMDKERSVRYQLKTHAFNR